MTNNIIEQIEQETGQRFDSNDGDNNTMAMLLGLVSRELGQSPPTYRKSDDLAAGLLIQHQTSPEYNREQATNETLVAALLMGFSPDDLR